MKTATASNEMFDDRMMSALRELERKDLIEQEFMDLRDRNEQLEVKIRLLQDHEKAGSFNAKVKNGTK